MKTLASLLVLAVTHGSALADEPRQPPTTVESVDLQRYVGLWYEVAKIPNRFQAQCVRGTTAEYSIRPDGRIDVLNRCVTQNGKTDEAKGLAKIEDRTSNAVLKVNFFKLLGLRLFWGDYWILGLGDDYEYAIVGSPDRKYGWILSRTPELAEETLEAIFAQLSDQGFDPGRFERSAP
jgi:apolipoprotein D and lipocalin family protein